MAAGTWPVRWVTCDEGYGAATVFLDRLAALGLGYGAEVPHSTRVGPTRPEMCVPPAPVTGRPPTRPARRQCRLWQPRSPPAPGNTCSCKRAVTGPCAPTLRLCGWSLPGAPRTAPNLSDTGSGAHDDGATGRAGGDAVADRNLLSGRQAAAGPGGLRRTQLDRWASPHDSVSAGPLLPGAAETPAPNKAPALTGPPMCRLRAALLPFTRVFSELESMGAAGSAGLPRVWLGQAWRERLSAAV